MDPHDARIAELEARVEALLARVAELEADNEALRQRLGRNSQNSSLPPSRDDVEARAAAAARRRSQQTRAGRRRKPGKQPGAEGNRLEPVEDPDRTERHRPAQCRGCGRSLAGAPVTAEERRQVHDVPARRYDTTEHVAQSCRCACGTTTKASFPPEAIGTVCWGPRLRAIAVYLRVRHQIPVARVAEILTDLMGAAVSAGWVAGLTVEGGQALDPFAAQLADRLAAEPVVHADETGTRVDGDKAWFHVLGTRRLTFLHVHRRRGAAAVEDMGVLGRFGGVLVSDRWATYWSYACAHQVCLSHILRDLAAVACYAGHGGWAEEMADHLGRVIHQCDRARAFGWDQLPPGVRTGFRATYDRIVVDGLAANPDPAGAGSGPPTSAPPTTWPSPCATTPGRSWPSWPTSASPRRTTRRSGTCACPRPCTRSPVASVTWPPPRGGRGSAATSRPPASTASTPSTCWSTCSPASPGPCRRRRAPPERARPPTPAAD